MSTTPYPFTLRTRLAAPPPRRPFIRHVGMLLVTLALLTLHSVVMAEPLMVSAAASFTDVLKTLKGRFESRHPEVEVRLNLGASGVLLQQISQGAPADVLITADTLTMDKAAQGGLIDVATRVTIARNTLVLIVPKESTSKPPTSVAELQRPEIQRIALGKPDSVPAGRYAQQALEKQGLAAALAPKLVPANSVRQVLDYVMRGEVDAGFVYATDAAIAPTVSVITRVDGYSSIDYPAAVVKGARSASAAQAFLNFLRSAEAQAYLREQGFDSP